jgi:hypothetical protein
MNEQELIKQIAINLSNANLRIIYEKYGYVEQLETFEFEKEAGYNPSGDEIKEWHEAVKNFLSSEIEPGVTLKNIIEFFYNIKEAKYGIILNRRLVEDYICYDVQIENKVYLDIDSKEDDDLFEIGEIVKIEEMNNTLVIMKRDELIKEEITLDPERHWII